MTEQNGLEGRGCCHINAASRKSGKGETGGKKGRALERALRQGVRGPIGRPNRLGVTVKKGVCRRERMQATTTLLYLLSEPRGRTPSVAPCQLGSVGGWMTGVSEMGTVFA